MRARPLVGLVAAVVAVAVVVVLSRAPIAVGAADTALVRLAFRARPERIEVCVEQTAEALEALPPHMRQSRVCRGEAASYRLQVWRDGAIIADRLVHGGGIRQDRPLYVFDEVAIPAGPSLITVRFAREVGEMPSAMATGEASGSGEGRPDLRQSVPAVLVLEHRAWLAPREVLLVSYDPDQRALVVVGP